MFDERHSGEPSSVIRAACPRCGIVVTAAVAVYGAATSFHPIDRQRCGHQELDLVLSDLAEGLDPHERCENCGHNPCDGGEGPWSCETAR